MLVNLKQELDAKFSPADLNGRPRIPVRVE